MSKGAGLVAPDSDDPLDWVRFHWERQRSEPGEPFLAMASVMRASQLMTAAIDRILKPLDLSRSSYMFLMTLVLSDSGARKMNRLSHYLLVHPTTVTLIADQLQGRGLVEREAHPTDRRALLCRITAPGRRLAERATKLLAKEDFGFAGLPPGAADEVIAVLTVARRAAGDGRPRAVPSLSNQERSG
ncbi:MAG: MarR family winged helix-turn-helix transcriptional regulator [Acidimicrobiia bacterium]